MKRFPYGAVLKIQREYSLQDIFARLESMRNLGFNIVVVWPAVFWWEDRALPDYPYHTGREILRYAEQIGLRVVMELAGQITSLEYAPDFLMKEEYYPVTFDGRRDDQQPYYGYLNYNHPEVKQLVHKVFAEAAERYKGFPALYGYDIWNETMFASHDRYTLQVFREWLRDKYATIQRLNAAWDRCYYDWSNIQFTKWMWSSVMPVVDYYQFRKENIGMFLKEWSGVIKSVDPHHPVIADNIHSMVTEDGSFDRPQDDWSVAEHVDEFGISFYPKSYPPHIPPHVRWEIFTAVRCATPSGRFWVSELQSHNQAMFTPISVVHPHELRWWNWEAISHGAKGMVYWMWEPFIKGLQTAGRGLVDYRGRYTQRALEARRISQIIAEHESEFASYAVQQPKAAILYDSMNHNFVRAYTLNYAGFVPTSIYTDSIKGLYRCLWDLNVPATFVTPRDLRDGNAHQFRAIFMSSQVVVGRELADAIDRYVEAGGTLIIDGRFGMVDDHGVLYDDIPGGVFHGGVGYRMLDVDLGDLTITPVDGSMPVGAIGGYYEKQLLDIFGAGAEVLAQFADGAPAIVRSSRGRGQIVQIASYLWLGYFNEGAGSVSDFMRWLARACDLSVYTTSNQQIKISALRGSDGMLVFAFNYAEQAASTELELGGIAASACSVVNLYTQAAERVPVSDQKLALSLTVAGRDVALLKIAFQQEAA